MKKESHLDGGTYKGYKVSVKLVREGLQNYFPKKIRNPEDVYNFLKDIENLDREVFYTLHLDAGNHIISCEEVSKGSLFATYVSPREVYKGAILSSSASIIAVHNHPSGDPTPSSEDTGTTKRLYEVGEIIGIPLTDSVIIGQGKYYSMQEMDEL